MFFSLKRHHFFMSVFHYNMLNIYTFFVSFLIISSDLSNSFIFLLKYSVFLPESVHLSYRFIFYSLHQYSQFRKEKIRFLFNSVVSSHEYTYMCLRIQSGSFSLWSNIYNRYQDNHMLPIDMFMGIST